MVCYFYCGCKNCGEFEPSHPDHFFLMDSLSKAQRSALMGRVRSKDTQPELAVRRLVHGMGYRYRLHDAKLPGKPDLVFRNRAKVIFVHGCFWHRHKGCPSTRTPKSNRKFWQNKFKDNISRDTKARKQLRRLGWAALIIWECEIGEVTRLAKRLREFLDG